MRAADGLQMNPLPWPYFRNMLTLQAHRRRRRAPAGCGCLWCVFRLPSSRDDSVGGGGLGTPTHTRSSVVRGRRRTRKGDDSNGLPALAERRRRRARARVVVWRRGVAACAAQLLFEVVLAFKIALAGFTADTWVLKVRYYNAMQWNGM